LQVSELLNKSPQTSLRDLKQSRLQISSINVSNSDDNDEELNLTLNKTKGRGRGSRGGRRGSRSPRGSRDRGKSNETNASILKMLV